ncbi:MAG: hypothetical protein ACREC6_02175 [Hyphomicrobiaceae bacterium]
MFGTLQDRPIKEPKKAGIVDMAGANDWIRSVYLPEHNARLAKPAALPDNGFAAVDEKLPIETLCIEEERIVARDTTVSWGRVKLQLPESRLRAHDVKARVRVHEYADGTLAVLHGPRRLAGYDAGERLLSAPTARSARRSRGSGRKNGSAGGSNQRIDLKR